MCKKFIQSGSDSTGANNLAAIKTLNSLATGRSVFVLDGRNPWPETEKDSLKATKQIDMFDLSIGIVWKGYCIKRTAKGHYLWGHFRGSRIEQCLCLTDKVILCVFDISIGTIKMQNRAQYNWCFIGLESSHYKSHVLLYSLALSRSVNTSKVIIAVGLALVCGHFVGNFSMTSGHSVLPFFVAPRKRASVERPATYSPSGKAVKLAKLAVKGAINAENCIFSHYFRPTFVQRDRHSVILIS